MYNRVRCQHGILTVSNGVDPSTRFCKTRTSPSQSVITIGANHFRTVSVCKWMYLYWMEHQHENAVRLINEQRRDDRPVHVARVFIFNMGIHCCQDWWNGIDEILYTISVGYRWKWFWQVVRVEPPWLLLYRFVPPPSYPPLSYIRVHERHAYISENIWKQQIGKSEQTTTIPRNF